MSSTQQTLIEIIAKESRLPVESISMDATMKDLDIHSLDAIQVIFEVEDRFKISISDRDAEYGASTVADLVAAIDAAVARKAAAAG